MFSHILECVRSLLTECDIVFIEEYPQKNRRSQSSDSNMALSIILLSYHVYSKLLNIAENSW